MLLIRDVASQVGVQNQQSSLAQGGGPAFSDIVSQGLITITEATLLIQLHVFYPSGGILLIIM